MLYQLSYVRVRPIVAPARLGDALYRLSMDADAVEIRVLGCLIEKQRTTPDAYPLAELAAARVQPGDEPRSRRRATEEREIKAALDRMSNRGWTRFASGASSRALKYRQLLDEALQLLGPELSLLGVLMLARRADGRRAEASAASGSHRFELDRRGRADPRRARAARARRRGSSARPGQKEERWRQLSAAILPRSPPPSRWRRQQPRRGRRPGSAAIEERLERLERRLRRL